MTSKPIVFLDCETTSLRPDRRAWEIAVIVRRPGQPDHSQQWMVDANDLDLGNADPMSLKVGGFYDRHPSFNPYADVRAPFSERDALRVIEHLTRGAVIYGSNPAFDVATLDARMRANGICPSWHYHPQDVPSMAAGWLHGRGLALPDPANSENLSLAVGVDPGKYDRHTAAGDCEWTRDIHAEITRGRS